LSYQTPEKLMSTGLECCSWLWASDDGIHSLLGSAESVGVHNFYSYTNSHMYILCLLSYAVYFLCLFFFFFSCFFKFNLYFRTGELVFLVFENWEF